MDEGRRKELEELSLLWIWMMRGERRLSPRGSSVDRSVGSSVCGSSASPAAGKKSEKLPNVQAQKNAKEIFHTKKQGEDFVFFVLTEVLDGVIVLVY